MNPLRPTLRGPHERGERPAGTTPPRAPGTGRNAENIDTMLGKPEQGKPESGSADRLPHERDQHLEEQRSEPRSNVEQAARDIESGQLDTDLHNTPGVERVVRERHAANRDDRDRQVANRSADDLAHKRGQTGGPSHSRDEHKG
ncbi:hypothetical protein ACTHR6_06205 [Ralstonia holmesii]|uniref:hypothetical protein n=1 Tax=Ralstonia TaxID=48736 RepID=UPI0004692FC1|nr:MULTISPECIES: hypothetical protein [Ralstonia]CAJ0704556.1 hypothetical protein R11007_04363 [Ralstonia sp. LMG 32967]